MILNLDASILMTNKNRTPPVGNGTSPCRIMCGLKRKKIIFTETVEFFVLFLFFQICRWNLWLLPTTLEDFSLSLFFLIHQTKIHQKCLVTNRSGLEEGKVPGCGSGTLRYFIKRLSLCRLVYKLYSITDSGLLKKKKKKTLSVHQFRTRIEI